MTKTTDNFYIATAIPYVNDKPHIGHAMDFMYADVVARYRRSLGDHVAFSIGTDEHGLKIAEKAAEKQQDPKEFADSIVPMWQNFASIASISNDRFVRTTDEGHVERSQLIWKNLKEYLYKGTYVGYYCVGCEEYKTETHVKETNGTCPLHSRPYEKLKEENYFFKLSAFTERLLIEIESGKFRVVPESKKNEIVNIIKGGLDDISVSRPKDKISWGIPVPGDTHHVMYVWFEALMNYITVLGYPEHPDFKTFWPADVQVIGKDILRFHAAIWPAMLMGLEIALPKTLYVHGHVTSDGKKMSKTLGNVIDPVALIEEYGADAVRYYLLRHIPSHDDGDFSLAQFLKVHDTELANELGNAVQRVGSMTMRYLDGVLGDVPESEHDQGQYHEALAGFRFDKALEEVWEQVRGLNQYIETTKPWEIAKSGDTVHLREVLAYCVSCLNEIADLLAPFMPTTATKILAIFKDGIVRLPATTLFPKKETEHAEPKV